MRQPATNRQKKLLRFFEVPFHDTITHGAAGWEICRILDDPDRRIRWKKYVFLTKDFSQDSEYLLPFKPEDLQSASVPEDWTLQHHVSQVVMDLLLDGSPFDRPEPSIIFKESRFCFTGEFSFGERTACAAEIVKRNGIVEKSVVLRLDYLIIGTQGSPAWKIGSYGKKIEKAVWNRRTMGNPAIVSEKHWLENLNSNKV